MCSNSYSHYQNRSNNRAIFQSKSSSFLVSKGLSLFVVSIYLFENMKFDNLYGHTDGINCITYWNTIAASGSDDHTVRLWDLKNQSSIAVLDGFFEKRITSLCHNPRMTKQLFVACGNKILEFDVRNPTYVVNTMESVRNLYSFDLLGK